MPRMMISSVLFSALLIAGHSTAPRTATACDSADQAFRSGSPVQTSGANRMPAQARPPIQLVNDPDSGGEVYFLIDGQEGSLKPGEAIDLPADRPHLIEFNTGGDRGDLRFSLYQGLYKFKVTPEGWGLFKSTPQASVAGRSDAPNQSTQVQRSYGPPMPAEDLRTRRQTAAESKAGAPPAKPAKPAAAQARQDQAQGAPPAPPAPGVQPERPSAPKTP